MVTRQRLIAPLILAMLVAVTPAFAQGQRWTVRAHALAVLPDDDSETVADTGTGFEVGSTAGAELDVAYRIAPSWDLELAAATASLDLATTGGQFPGIDAGSLQMSLGTLSLQYHFATRGRFKPYLGLGITFATLSGYRITEGVRDLGVAALRFSDSLRLGSHAGADFELAHGWLANLTISYIPATTRIDLLLPTGATFDSLSVQINPVTVALGIGHRF